MSVLHAWGFLGGFLVDSRYLPSAHKYLETIYISCRSRHLSYPPPSSHPAIDIISHHIHTLLIDISRYSPSIKRYPYPSISSHRYTSLYTSLHISLSLSLSLSRLLICIERYAKWTARLRESWCCVMVPMLQGPGSYYQLPPRPPRALACSSP